ncbi:Abcc6 [Symbiodinium sp. CCMP2592]|nr:Abcc6 [Symbiodinium sp. CCMP2592]
MERCCCLRIWRAREPPLLSDEEAPEEVSPEDASWPLSRLLFFWAFPVLWRGYRRGRTDLGDLPAVPAADRPSVLIAEVLSSFALPSEGTTGRRPWLSPLHRRLFKVTWPVFFQGSVCQALLQVFSYLQPILLHGLLQSLSMPEEQRKEQQTSVALHSLGIAAAVMGMWIFAEYAWNIFVRADLRAQVLLCHLTYRKSLHLRLDGCAYTIGDLQNHFSTDCSKPVQGFFHWSHASIVIAAITVIVVAWHLTSLIGSAGLIGMLVVSSFAPLQLVLSHRIKRYSQKIQEAMALEMLEEAREAELSAQWGKRKVFPFNNFLGSTVSLFGTIAAFVSRQEAMA